MADDGGIHSDGSADFDDVPPLEDMSEMINKIKTTSIQASGSNYISDNPNLVTLAQPGDKAGTKALPKVTPKQSSFGGMKKGFLFSPSTSKQKPSKSDSDMPFIKANKSSQEDGLKIPEVQQVMQAGRQFAENTEWVTEDLLAAIQKNDKLVQRLQNPQFMQAVTEFQTNPSQAMAKYSGNPEMEIFLREFCGLLGDHFTKFAEKSKPPGVQTAPSADIQVHQSPEDVRVQQLLSDPHVRELLLDPEVQNFIQMLRISPGEAHRSLMTASQGFQEKVRKLTRCGLLQVQPT